MRFLQFGNELRETSMKKYLNPYKEFLIDDSIL